MKISIPEYFGEFECTASACPDTCCAGWAIMIDSDSMKKYRKVKGALGNRLKNSIDLKSGSFQRYKNRCVFLNEKNLCDLYLEAGADYLCRTCRNYPRHIEEFEGLREITLSMSCPVVAKLLLSNTEKVRFLFFEEEEIKEDKADPSFDFFLFTKLCDARDWMIHCLQNRELDISLRLSMVIAFAHDLQLRIQQDVLFGIEELLARYSKESAFVHFQLNQNQNQDRILAESGDPFELLGHLEILNPEWPSFLKRIQKGNSHNTVPALYYEQMMIYFLSTYFCGAVYDRHAYSKAKFALVNTILIAEMMKRAPSEIKPWEIAYRFCREVEHSDLNIQTMEDALRKEYPLHVLLHLLQKEEDCR